MRKQIRWMRMLHLCSRVHLREVHFILYFDMFSGLVLSCLIWKNLVSCCHLFYWFQFWFQFHFVLFYCIVFFFTFVFLYIILLCSILFYDRFYVRLRVFLNTGLKLNSSALIGLIPWILYWEKTRWVDLMKK